MSGDRVAVILAGGKGTRLAPYTAVLPKPLVPLGQYPVVEILVRQLISAGFGRLVFSTGYLAELIRAYFHSHPLNGSGARFYWVTEPAPLGTAGPLRLVEDLPEHFLVLNGDIFTTMDFGAFFDRHAASGAALTIAVHGRTVDLPLGVVKHSDCRVTGYTEKPSYSFDVSMGIYAYSRRALDFIPDGERMDFPDLVLSLLEAGETVLCEESSARWLDIGNPEDYAAAQEEFLKDPSVYLSNIAR